MSTTADNEIDDMQEINDDFLVEADELINSLDENLVRLESKPDDLDLLNQIFRAAHTIKGTSSFLGFDQVAELTHKMEDILNRLRKGEMVVNPSIMDLLLASVDFLKILLQRVKDHETEPIDLKDILSRLDIGLTSQDGNLQTPIAKIEAATSVLPEEPKTIVPEAIESELKEILTPSQFPNAQSDPKAVRQGADKKHEQREQTIRVDIERIDTLMNLMGELVLGRNSLVQSVSLLSQHGDRAVSAEQLNQSTASINCITTELQLAVMKMRMQSVGKVFAKFPRLVRDLSRDSGKEIDLVISGETTELDKSVIEEIGDPLVHIIRNSCDHGIESPKERIAKGKTPKGTVYLTAAQEGSNIVLTIRDDGKGLDIQAIRAKAVERGLNSKAEVDKLTDKEVFSYIFEPGFSTAKKITDVSGRGVGMDVVRTNIEKLNGQVELDSAIDVGTTITIKLPLTLAIIQGLLVESDNDIYILPLGSVYETVRTELSEINFVNQRPVLCLRNEVVPVITLGPVLRSDKAGFMTAEKPYIVIVGLADKKLGISIDRFLRQEEVVIKSLGDFLGGAEGIAGATILGDGRIRLIVDLIGLFNLVRKLR